MMIVMYKCFQFVFAISLFFSSGCSRDDKPHIIDRYDFNKVVSIWVYDIDLRGVDDKAILSWSEEYCNKFTKADFNSNLFKELIKQTKYKKPKKLWKGPSNLIVVTFSDGFVLKLETHYRGGDFRIIGEKSYYSLALDANACNKWNEAYEKSIVQEIFIPNR